MEQRTGEESGKAPGLGWLREEEMRPGEATVTWTAEVSSKEAGGPPQL